MAYNPHIHHRSSIRLKGYDYSQAGLYFITICCQDRICLFGEIRNGKMIWNDAGKIANACWSEIPRHFPNVALHEYIVMPNHVHGIIEIVGAKDISSDGTDVIGAKDISPLRGTSKTVGSIVRGFKIGVTKWMRQHTQIYHVWQRNYYEHIIRNENSYHRIAEYIANNPINWHNDGFFAR